MKKLETTCRIAFFTFAIWFALRPTEVWSQTPVNCDAGATIRAALSNAKPGETLTVSGTCNESLTIDADISRITLDGRGTANIVSPNSTLNTITIRGKEITIRGFTVTGGNNGVILQRGASGTIDGNIIRGNGLAASSCQCASGILVGPLSSAVIINNTIENNGNGISVDENSNARVGFQVPTVLGLPNIIQNNINAGIAVLHNSSARIIGATIRNNGGDGVQIERASHVDISDNSISGNGGNGINVRENSGVNLDLGRIQAVAQPNRTHTELNGGFGITCSLGSYVSGSAGSLMGSKGALNADSTCMGLDPLVVGLSFDLATVAPGETFSTTFSGLNLSLQTYFDVRFGISGRNTEQEALNWQFGTTATHTVPSTIPTGTYSVSAVRAHKELADHNGPYIPVSASITVR